MSVAKTKDIFFEAQNSHLALGKPYRFSPSEEQLANVIQRVSDYVWHEMPNDGGWDYGTNLHYLQKLCHHWIHKFNWWDHQDKLDQFSHYRTEVDEIETHYIFEKGSGSNPIPLLISHGWPGSICEFLEIIEPLAHPERFGGSIDDAFDVVAPSLPGFGFSGRPPLPAASS